MFNFNCSILKAQEQSTDLAKTKYKHKNYNN